MNLRILYLKLIFLPYVRLCMVVTDIKYFSIIHIYLPMRRLKNTLKYILKLRIHCGIPLRIGWESAQDTIRKMEREHE